PLTPTKEANETVGTELASARAARGRHVAVHSLCACHHLSDRGQPHKRELKGSAWDKKGISERSCLVPTLVDRLPGSAQGTNPTVSRPPFVLTHFLKFAPMGASPVPTVATHHRSPPFPTLLLESMRPALSLRYSFVPFGRYYSTTWETSMRDKVPAI